MSTTASSNQCAASSGSWPHRRLTCWLLVALALALPAAFSANATAAKSPTPVYTEDFENTGNDAILLTAYQGAAAAHGETYTAASGWLRDCNGWVMTGTSPVPADTRNCSAAYFPTMRSLVKGLGSHQGQAEPAANHALTAYTFTCGDPASPQFGKNEVCGGANQVQWETKSQIAVPPNRFYTFAVDAAYTNCHVAHPLFNFSIVAGVTEVPLSSIDGCSKGNGAYTFSSSGSVLITGSSIGLRLRNGQASAVGNDGAVDNIRLLDVTPTMSKAFSPANLHAGASSTLTFTIENTTELGVKNGWSFTDVLPAGLLVANPADASTTCSSGSVAAPAGGNSIAVSGSFDAGQAACAVSVKVTSPNAGSFDNCPANVTTVGLEPPPCARVRFEEADVKIAKSATPDPAVPGKPLTYELAVTNDGPDAAQNVVVTDELPNGLTFVSAGDGCSEAAGKVTCNVGALAVGASNVYEVTVKVPSSQRECPRNTATVTSATPDPNPVDNSSTACPQPKGQADLSIAKTPSATLLPPGGGQVVYTLVVENDGPSDATGVKVADPMAAGLTLVAADPSQGSCSSAGGRLACDLGPLAQGGSAQVLVTADARPTGAAIANTAYVGAEQEDPEPKDNEGTATIDVPFSPAPPAPAPPSPPIPSALSDLSVEKRTGVKRSLIGRKVPYKIVVENNGPAAAAEVKLTDTFNHAGGVVSVKTTAGSCRKGLPLRCSLGTIQPGTRVTVTVVLKPRDSGCRQRNAVSATAAGGDGNPADNLDTVDVCVTGAKPILVVKKVASTGFARPGAVLSYTITVRNKGKGEARKVKVCDRPPKGLKILGSQPRARKERAPCWRIGRLAAGKKRVFRVTAQISNSARGLQRNLARVSAANARAKRIDAATVRVAPLPQTPCGSRLARFDSLSDVVFLC